MSQSLVKIYIHLIFHIKTTSVAIQETDQEKLNAYVAGVVNKMGCSTVAVGGMRDHLHVLFRLSSVMSLADVVMKLKKASHKYLETLDSGYSRFNWQNGYGAFSVGPQAINDARDYVLHQREHHRDKDFSKEYLMFLRAYDVEFDERYLLTD